MSVDPTRQIYKPFYLIHQLCEGLDGGSYVDIGALWGIVQETLSTAKWYTDDLSIIDISCSLYPGMEGYLHWHGVRDVRYIHADILNYHDTRQFDRGWCSGVFYHLYEPWKLVDKLMELIRGPFVLGSMVVPEGTFEEDPWKIDPSNEELMDRIRNAWAEGWTLPHDHSDSHTPIYWAYSPSAIRSVLESRGLRVRCDFREPTEFADYKSGSRYWALCDR